MSYFTNDQHKFIIAGKRISSPSIITGSILFGFIIGIGVATTINVYRQAPPIQSIPSERITIPSQIQSIPERHGHDIEIGHI